MCLDSSLFLFTLYRAFLVHFIDTVMKLEKKKLRDIHKVLLKINKRLSGVTLIVS